MKNLKTLKDIEHKSENAYPFIDQFKYILKQEAINWVKELNKDILLFKYSPEAHSKKEEYEESLVRTSNQILWIKHFFNLTEEDLK